MKTVGVLVGIFCCFLVVHGKTATLRRQQSQPCSYGDGPDCIYVPWKANTITSNHTT